MTNIQDIMWDTMQKNYKNIIDGLCREYKSNPKYRILEIFEENQLKGFGVYHDYEGIRYIHEVHYVGKNPYVALKFWKWFKKDAKKLCCIAMKANTRMLDFYCRLGFNIVSEDFYNCYLMR